jgi:rubredoxin
MRVKAYVTIALAVHLPAGAGPMEPYKSWMCVICGFVYHEADGWPDDGIAPGTRWEDIPPNWRCPECGADKDDFEMVEI